MLSLFKWLAFTWLGCWVIVLGIIAACYLKVWIRDALNK